MKAAFNVRDPLIVIRLTRKIFKQFGNGQLNLTLSGWIGDRAVLNNLIFYMIWIMKTNNTRLCYNHGFIWLCHRVSIEVTSRVVGNVRGHCLFFRNIHNMTFGHFWSELSSSVLLKLHLL